MELKNEVEIVESREKSNLRIYPDTDLARAVYFCIFFIMHFFTSINICDGFDYFDFLYKVDDEREKEWLYTKLFLSVNMTSLL